MSPREASAAEFCMYGPTVRQKMNRAMAAMTMSSRKSPPPEELEALSPVAPSPHPHDCPRRFCADSVSSSVYSSCRSVIRYYIESVYHTCTVDKDLQIFIN